MPLRLLLWQRVSPSCRPRSAGSPFEPLTLAAVTRRAGRRCQAGDGLLCWTKSESNDRFNRT